MKILIDNRDENFEIPDFLIEDFKKALTLILSLEKVYEPVEVSVSFVKPKEIKALNKEYRNKDSITDVLSFPTDMNIHIEGIPVMLGDVVICMERAREQSIEYGHSFERELIYLFVHSIFHLLGYDHIDENDKILMRHKEKKVLKELGIFRDERQ